MNTDEPSPVTNLNFENIEVAFANKSNKELKKAQWLFNLMNKATLVKVGSSLANFAIRYKLPFTETIIKNTIFEHFCGGENLVQCQKTIDRLHKNNVLSILDYGAEAKDDDDEFNAVVAENMKAIEMAASNNSVPVVVVKVSGIVNNEVLEKLNRKETLDAIEQKKLDDLKVRLNKICEKASNEGVGVFIDAEESWIQDPIDELTLDLMKQYNKEKVIIYNTYQLYRWDKLGDLIAHHNQARENNHLFGAKLVRGAYMEKERKRAEEMGYKSPIQPNKEASDKDYDLALRYCFDHYETISFCCASHNAKSNMLLANLIAEYNVDRTHPHLNFCQLQGMSDNITFNLANEGYNAAKYVVYGPVKDVVPYLIRRAQENASITGEVGRELKMIQDEMKRRGM